MEKKRVASIRPGGQRVVAPNGTRAEGAGQESERWSGRRMPTICLILAGLWLANPLRAATGFKSGICFSGQASTEGFQHFLGYEMGGLSGGALLGFQAGFFKTFDLSRRLQVQSEIFYALRGGDGSTTFLYDDIVYRIKIHYVEFPLTLKFRVWGRGAFSAAVFAGPYAALKLKAEKKTRIWRVEESTPLENVKKLDYGVILGLAAEYDGRLGRVLLELRSGYGLGNSMEAIPGAIRLHPGKDAMRNVYVAVLMGIGF